MEDELENNFVNDKSGELDSEELIRKRKDKIFSYFKKSYYWVTYAFLAIVVFLAVKIRTRNLDGLRDVTTNSWTLGPDLDPFLFLRYAKEIVANGTLAAVDYMRSVPLGFPTNEGFKLHYYLIAWFHNILGGFFGVENVTHSAVIYPVFMFAITVIAFFFLVRKIFVKRLGVKKASVIALVASFFLSVMPSLLPRTIAGIPEKESAAFFFLFASYYLFLKSWESKKLKNNVIFGLLAGIFTASMALIWGGYAYIFIVLGPTVLVAFLLNKLDKNKIITFVTWIFASFFIMIYYAPRYNLSNLITSVTTGSAVVVLLIIGIDWTVHKTRIERYFRNPRIKKLPPRILSLIVSLIVFVFLGSLIFGIDLVPNRLSYIKDNLIKPAGSRLIQTVAENRQPYFNEWAGNFGPNLQGFPITFWLFFIGSIVLFYNLLNKFKKNERITMTLAYVVFLIGLIFSRHSSESVFNGENTISIGFYLLSFIFFVWMMGYYYFKHYKKDSLENFKMLNIGFVFVFVYFFIAIISARSAVRLVMMLVPPASIIISYISVESFYYAKNSIKSKEKKWVGVLFSVIIILFAIFAGNNLYKSSNSIASSYVPSSYNQQWQNAMHWVRESTPKDAVFGHWWDYGYWVQSIGERATVLDGGNVISYWNHLMGRYGLTSKKDEKREMLEYFYAHDVTHFLIDSTDIGKYGAFSFIGSNEDLDRRSYIPTFQRDNSQTIEKKNTTLEIYSGGVLLDEDLIYEEGEGKIFLPANRAAVGAIIIERNSDGDIVNLEGVFIDQGQQYRIPLRYYYDGKFVDMGKGYESGIFLYPKINEIQGGQINIEHGGSMLYLSNRVVNSNLARNYLYDEPNDYFKLAHIESDFFIESLRTQGIEIGEFADYRGLRGPIKIWEVNYPSGMIINEDFLITEYPSSLRLA